MGVLAAWGCHRSSGRGVRCPGSVGAVAGRGAVLLPWPGIMAAGGSSVLPLIVVGCGGAWVQVVRVRSACLGCWRRCLVSSVFVIVAAGGPAAVGVLFPFGPLPQVHSQLSGVPEGVFPALTRRGLALLPQKPRKRATFKNRAKNKKRKITKTILTNNSNCHIIVTVRREK